MLVKTLFRLLRAAAAYCTLIAGVFFGFAAIGGLGGYGMRADQFLVLFICGLVLAAAEYLFCIRALAPLCRWLFHYLAVIASLLTVFAVAGKFGGQGASRVLVAFVLLSALYVLAVCIFFLYRRLANRKTPDKNECYVPLYSHQDKSDTKK